MSIEKKLRLAWGKELLILNAKGLGYILVCIVGLILADLLIDWQFLLPGYGRLALLLINIGILGWVFYKQWLRYLKRYDPFRIALQVEEKHPELKSALVSYIQLDESLDPSISAQLIRATRRQAVRIGERLNFGVIASLRELIRPSILAGCAAILFVLISLSWPQFISILFYRMVNPSANLTYPTRTRIEFITGDIIVRHGEPVEIAAQCGGEIPKEGELYVQFDEDNWEELEFVQEEGSFIYRFDKVFRDFSYYTRLGDSVSRTYKTKVVSSPLLLQRSVRFQYPEYTGMEFEETHSLNLKVPKGTKVQWLLQTDVPISEAYMLREGKNRTSESHKADMQAGAALLSSEHSIENSIYSGSSQPSVIPMKLEENGQSVTFDLEAIDPFGYSFRWKESSHGYVFDDKAHYSVDVIPDAAPEIKIVYPVEKEEKATIQKTLHIAFQANDEYGLTKAWLIHSVNGGPERKYSIGSLEGKSVERKMELQLADFIPEIMQGDEVTCAIQVVDNCEFGEPNTSSSDPIHISIVSVEEYLAHMLKRKNLLMEEIEALYKEEDEAHGRVEVLKQMSSKTVRETQ